MTCAACAAVAESQPLCSFGGGSESSYTSFLEFAAEYCRSRLRRAIALYFADRVSRRGGCRNASDEADGGEERETREWWRQRAGNHDMTDDLYTTKTGTEDSQKEERRSFSAVKTSRLRL